jgi:hypothetical protein
VPVSGDIILPSQRRGGQTLEDMEAMGECLPCLAIALLNPESAYTYILITLLVVSSLI